ncbi:MAG TPA: response regulator transcription factor [Chitinophagaceae bacterium]
MYKKIPQVNLIIGISQKSDRDDLARVICKTNGFMVAGFATDANMLVKQSCKYRPAIIITETVLRRSSGIDAVKTIKTKLPETKIIVVSKANDKNHLFEIFSSGVNGILQKKMLLREIIPAVIAVQNKNPYFCSETMRMVQRLITATAFSKANLHPNKQYEKILNIFTPKETDVIKLLCRGYTNQDIGDHFGNSKRTVEGIREMILKKSGTKNTAAVVVYAIRNKIFDCNEC